MLKISPTQSAKNLPSSIDRAENAEIGNRISYITQSAKNSPLNMAEDPEVVGNGDAGDDKMVKISLIYKKTNKPKEYFTSLHFKKR